MSGIHRDKSTGKMNNRNKRHNREGLRETRELHRERGPGHINSLE